MFQYKYTSCHGSLATPCSPKTIFKDSGQPRSAGAVFDMSAASNSIRFPADLFFRRTVNCAARDVARRYLPPLRTLRLRLRALRESPRPRAKGISLQDRPRARRSDSLRPNHFVIESPPLILLHQVIGRYWAIPSSTAPKKQSLRPWTQFRDPAGRSRQALPALPCRTP
jgi:hypothetical protein